MYIIIHLYDYYNEIKINKNIIQVLCDIKHKQIGNDTVSIVDGLAKIVDKLDSNKKSNINLSLDCINKLLGYSNSVDEINKSDIITDIKTSLKNLGGDNAEDIKRTIDDINYTKMNFSKNSLSKDYNNDNNIFILIGYI